MIARDRVGAGRSARRRLGLSNIVLTLSTLAIVSLTGCSASGQSSAADSYGALPTFLPSASLHADAPLTGSTASPALTSQGDDVVVQYAGTSLTINVVGPVVPGEGLPYQTPATTCTWTVTMSAANVEMPIDLQHFNAIDQFGKIYQVTPPATEAKPPTSIHPGQTVTFKLRAILPTGEGDMRYSPDGQRVAASWDFVVEND